MKITTRRAGAGFVEVKVSEDGTQLDLGFLDSEGCAELARDLRDAADVLAVDPKDHHQRLIDALEDAVNEIRALSGKDNSCDASPDVSEFEAVIAAARAAR